MTSSLPLISIVIPVYNVEEYLVECIESICGQTYSNIEIILVDDGSTDSCPAICDDFATKDSRISVFHQSNQGVSVARNKGIEVSNGEYICFVDADDILNPHYLGKMIDALVSEPNRIIACDYTVNEEELLNPLQDSEHLLLEIEDFFELLRTQRTWGSSIWNKLFPKVLFQGIVFPVGRAQGEDLITVDRLVLKSNGLIKVSQPLYFYRNNVHSVMNNQNVTTLKDILNSYVEEIDLLKNTGLHKGMCLFQLDSFLHRYWDVKEINKNAKIKRKIILRSYRKVYVRAFNYLTLKQKLGYGIYIFSPNICSLISKK